MRECFPTCSNTSSDERRMDGNSVMSQSQTGVIGYSNCCFSSCWGSLGDESRWVWSKYWKQSMKASLWVHPKALQSWLNSRIPPTRNITKTVSLKWNFFPLPTSCLPQRSTRFEMKNFLITARAKEKSLVNSSSGISVGEEQRAPSNILLSVKLFMMMTWHLTLKLHQINKFHIWWRVIKALEPS